MPQGPRMVPPPKKESTDVVDEIVDLGYNDVGDGISYSDVGDTLEEGRKPDTPQVSDDEDESGDLLIDEGPGSAKPVSIDSVPDSPQVSTLPPGYSVMPPTSDLIGPPTFTASRFDFDVQNHRLIPPIHPSEVMANQKTLTKLQNFADTIKKSARFRGPICWSGIFKLTVDPNYFGVISLDGFSDIPIPRSGVRLLSYLTASANILWTVIDPTGTRFYDGLTYIGTFLKQHLLDSGRVATTVVNFGIQSPQASHVAHLGHGLVNLTATTTATSTTPTVTPPSSTSASTSTSTTSTVGPTLDQPEPIRTAVTLESLPDGFPIQLAAIPKPPPFDWSKATHEVLSCSDRRIQFRRLSNERLFPRLVRDYNGRCDNVQLQRRRELEVQNACGHRPYRHYVVWRTLSEADKSSFRTFAQE